MKKILLVHTYYSSFVKTDYEILTTEYDVIRYKFDGGNSNLKHIGEFIKQFFYLLLNIRKFDAVYIWFGDYHTFLPVMFAKIFRKKSFVVIGGYDVANLSDLKYGSLATPLRKIVTLYSFRHATLCLPVVEELDDKLKKILPNVSSQVVYTGYDSDIFKIKDGISKRKQVLTVSITKTKSRLLLKGLDRFIELAKLLPNFDFVIVGIEKENKNLFNDLPTNISLKPPCNLQKLITYYSTSKFYAQFSLSEGLPNAICEAMLCQCIPLGTNVGGIKTAIGENGLVTGWDVKKFKDYILSNQTNHIIGLKAREYVIRKFASESRKNIIHRLIK